jgi:hypothetical protein
MDGEFEPLVQRNKGKEEVEPIDIVEQEKFIQDISKKYSTTVRNNRILIYICCGVFLVIHSALFYLSGNKIPQFVNMAAYVFAIIAEIARKKHIWIVSVALEIIAIVLDYFYPLEIDFRLVIVLHIVYFLILYHKLASKRFEDEFPDEIKNLEKKKYQYKIA